jgi:hypothetical protein
MRIAFVLLLLSAAIITSCSDKKNIPDVSNIKVGLSVQRFEKDLFTIDTSDFALQLDKLQAKYPAFGENFIYTVLNADAKWPPDTVASYVAGFVKEYRKVYDSSEKVFKNFTAVENEIKKGLQFLKYYFPAYKAPSKVVTFIGPVDGIGIALDSDAFCVGLQSYLGKDFPLYKSEQVLKIYPEYVSRRFEPDYIAINCMQLVTGEIYPEKLEDKPLVQQMVEKGKSLYLLQKILPYTAENKLIGYTEQQMKMCYANEVKIWSLFTQNNMLQTIDNNIIRNYIGESPKTQELSDDNGNFAPGNIGSFAGWQIIKKYMNKYPETKLPDLLAMDAETIFEKAKYKP